MATYKAIKGIKVQNLSSDPTLAEGDVWYNTTSNALKYAAVSVLAGTWSSGNVTNSGRHALASGGTQSAGFIAGGGQPTRINETELFDGTNWTVSGNLPSVNSYLCGYGASSSAGFAACGTTPGQSNATQSFDGSTWTAQPAANTARSALGGAGTSTSGIIMGGQPPYYAITETFNGSSWTETSNLNQARSYNTASGTSNTSALCFFGSNPTGYGTGMVLTEEWDGSTWTEVGDMNNVRSGCQQCGGLGTPSNTLAFGGQPGNIAYTEFYNGTAWTELADLATGRGQGGGGGNSLAAFYACGASSATPSSTVTEVWNGALGALTVTVS